MPLAAAAHCGCCSLLLRLLRPPGCCAACWAVGEASQHRCSSASALLHCGLRRLCWHHSQLCGCSVRPGHQLNTFVINLHYSLLKPDPCTDLCAHMLTTSSNCHVPTEGPFLVVLPAIIRSHQASQPSLMFQSLCIVGSCQVSSGVKLCIGGAANSSRCVGLLSLAVSASLVMWGRLIVAP
jgi:hypothetical protein